MPVSKIIFLCSGDQLCRCLIAKNILLSIDSKLDVYAAAIPPPVDLSDEQKRVVKEFGFEISEDEIRTIDEFPDIDFDYLITVSHGIRDQLKKYPLHYKTKLHMEFADFIRQEDSHPDIPGLLLKIKDEIENELGYFYYHILNPTAG